MLKKMMTMFSFLVLWSGFFISPVAVVAGGGQSNAMIGDERTQLIISEMTLRTATSGGKVETSLLSGVEESQTVAQSIRSSWLGIGLEIILVGSALILFWKKKINLMSMALVVIATSWIVAFIFWLTLGNFWWSIILTWILNSLTVVFAVWRNSKK